MAQWRTPRYASVHSQVITIAGPLISNVEIKIMKLASCGGYT